MVKSEFDILRYDGQVYISREDLVAYLNEETRYTAVNARGTELSDEFVDGMVASLATIAGNVGRIGK